MQQDDENNHAGTSKILLLVSHAMQGHGKDEE